MHCCNINKSRRGGIFFWFTWYIAKKLDYLGYISAAKSVGCIKNHFYVMHLKATEFGEIRMVTAFTPLLRRSRSFKVTQFGTNRKLIFDFLLVITSNLGPCIVSEI